MIDEPITAFSAIVAAAVAGQWIAARLRVPSVVLLLAFGVAMSAVVDPDALLGNLLFPVVSMGVAILLFEGGLGLRWGHLGIARTPVLRLVTIGVGVTWVVVTVAVSVALDVPRSEAVLIGAILTVSGPTVVLPLLRIVRPREPAASILRWEGILIDPIGAALAVIVLDAIIEDRARHAVLWRLITTLGAGLAVGLIVAAIVVEAMRRHLVPDNLQIALSLASVLGAFAVANELRPEAGLLAATVLGIAFANQRGVPAGHIAEFNEHLGSIVLGVLFILLGARVDLEEVLDNLLPSVFILAAIIFVARPLTVLASTLGTKTSWRDRAFIMTLAPRGVVAAAVASLFALTLSENGIDPGPMVAVVFTVVVGTVVGASLVARTVGARLKVIKPTPTGVALIGGHEFSISLAERLANLSVPVMLVGLDDEDADRAEERHLMVYRGRLDSDEFLETTDTVGISKAVALSGSTHADTYAIQRLTEVVGRANVYALPTGDESADRTTDPSSSVSPRPAVPFHLTASRVEDLLARGARLRVRQARRAGGRGWVTICRVDHDAVVSFGTNAPSAATADSSLLIQIGPRADTIEGPTLWAGRDL